MDFKMHSLHDAFVEIQKYCKKQSIPKEVCYNINLVAKAFCELKINISLTAIYSLIYIRIS